MWFTSAEFNLLAFSAVTAISLELDLKRLADLLYGSVAWLPSPSSNIEARPYGALLRFALLRSYN